MVQDVEPLKAIASAVKNSGVLQSLTSQQDALKQALEANPEMGAALQAHPQLAQLITADGISRLIDAVNSGDPGLALKGIVGDKAPDLSQQRKLLIQLQNFTAQLKLSMPRQQAAANRSTQQQQQHNQLQQDQQQQQQQQLLMMRLQNRMAKMQGMQAMANAGVGPALPAASNLPWQQQLPQQLPISFPAANPSPDSQAAASFSNWAGPEPNNPNSSFSGWLPGRAPSSEADSLLQPDARTYYEAVAPSKWKPGRGDNYLELYRRAYCLSADALFPPLWFATITALSYGQVLNFWLLMLVSCASFLLGVYCMGVVMAGVPSKKLEFSKIPLSFLISFETISFLTYLNYIAPVGHWLQQGKTLLFLIWFTAMAIAHYMAMTSDPGFVPLPGEQQRSSSKDGSTPPLGHFLDTCWTCKVPRQLRQKHCPACNRCVHKFDHHCGFLGTCIGQGNQRSFACFLTFAIITATLFTVHSCHAMVALYSAAHPAVASSSNSFALFWRSLYSATGTHRGLLLLTLLQIPLEGVLVVMFLRCAICITGNLTVNELYNKDRYLYLKHETAGFCNRFDMGIPANCWQFWMEPVQDWWAIFEANDRAMVQSGRTYLVYDSITTAIRMFDKQWQAQRRALEAARKQQQQQRVQRALERMGVDQAKAAQLAAVEDKAGCQQGGCSSCQAQGGSVEHV